jgi:hypothetical protein
MNEFVRLLNGILIESNNADSASKLKLYLEQFKRLTFKSGNKVYIDMEDIFNVLRYNKEFRLFIYNNITIEESPIRCNSSLSDRP